ncbi:DUF5655 domain-containing protein [Adhaeribacter pallidiroseus]|uniref:DUF5655 domain-containing protein n=1 Tax=Adhaeribacter pallidiroseus TaxID=2072847 RepID=A0A369QNR5_9BACT|nr:DUF5655 domain-containing protein [Adhaeribacter pallidiroseus]RDC66020.1 hypothetical protein AHMF7616_04651 [Adhaeribacter pallidiroseus]
MPIFQENNGQLKKLKINTLTKEKSLQLLIEQNLLEVLDMHLLATEYSTTFGGRIDTLAVDMDGAPVIIEYKLNRNDNVINQALSYLRWLKAQKVEFFEMLIIRKLGKELSDKLKIDWQNPRVICIAENYSKFDIDTVEVIPMRLELFKYRYYENGIFSLEPLNTNASANEKSEAITTTNSIPENINFTNEITNSVNKNLVKAPSSIRNLFEELRSRILQMDENVIEKPNSRYIAYRLSKNFAEVHLGKQQIKMYLRPANYDDPLNKVEKMPESYHWAMDRRVYLNNLEELDYVMQLIEQSYNDVL